MLYSISSQRVLRHIAEASIVVFLALMAIFILHAPVPSASAEETAYSSRSLSLIVDRGIVTISSSGSGYVLTDESSTLESSARPATNSRILSGQNVITVVADHVAK